MNNAEIKIPRFCPNRDSSDIILIEVLSSLVQCAPRNGPNEVFQILSVQFISLALWKHTQQIVRSFSARLSVPNGPEEKQTVRGRWGEFSRGEYVNHFRARIIIVSFNRGHISRAACIWRTDCECQWVGSPFQAIMLFVALIMESDVPRRMFTQMHEIG